MAPHTLEASGGKLHSPSQGPLYRKHANFWFLCFCKIGSDILNALIRLRKPSVMMFTVRLRLSSEETVDGHAWHLRGSEDSLEKQSRASPCLCGMCGEANGKVNSQIPLYSLFLELKFLGSSEYGPVWHVMKQSVLINRDINSWFDIMIS